MNDNSMNDNAAKTLSTNKEWYLDVSQEQYEAMRAEGIEEEALLKPGRHVFRRRDPSKIIRKTNTTVAVQLDEQTLAFLRRRANEQHNHSVEAQIQCELRALAEREAA